MELIELRKTIRALGFKIKSESLSWGKHITYVNIQSGEALTFNCSQESVWEKWKPLLDFLKSVPSGTILTDKGQKIYGSKFP